MVEVGTSPITAADVLADTRRLTLARPTGDIVADRRRLIEPIIQSRLLVLEAQSRGFDDESVARELKRIERDALVRELEQIEIRDTIVVDRTAVDEEVRRRALLDSTSARPAVTESLQSAVEEEMAAAEFGRRQIAFLDTMKVRLHFTVIDSVLDRFLSRMKAWDSGGAPQSPPAPPPASGLDRFGFSESERPLAIFTFDGGRFTLGDYADYMAREPDGPVRMRTDRQRVLRDLDQYFRHHAYAEVARARGYLELSGIVPELKRRRERRLIDKLYQAEVAIPAPPNEKELRAAFQAHPERYARPGSARVETADCRDEDAARRLISLLEQGKEWQAALALASPACGPSAIDTLWAGEEGYEGIAQAPPGKATILTSEARGVAGRRVARLISLDPARSPQFEEVRERVVADRIAEGEEKRYQALIARLKQRYRIVYHEDALRRLPL